MCTGHLVKGVGGAGSLFVKMCSANSRFGFKVQSSLPFPGIFVGRAVALRVRPRRCCPFGCGSQSRMAQRIGMDLLGENRMKWFNK